jgi:hypothetical protein
MRERAEAWRARTSAFANVMLGLFYLSGATVVATIGWLIYQELK